MSEVPVIAVIPNYNMAKSLAKLLTLVLKQGYDQVFVLDDNSSDDSAAVVSKFAGKVRFIAGKSNAGPGANRNRILEVDGLDDAIIHFMDADLTIDSENNPSKARGIFSNKKLGLVGGLVKEPDGMTSMFNYGPRYSIYSAIGGFYQARFYKIAKTNHDKAARYRRRRQYWVKDFPNILLPPQRKRTYWVGEANMLIPYSVFKHIGGFDARLLYHEIQDLAIRLHKAGYEASFDPSIATTHPFFDLKDMNLRALRSHAATRLLLTHGLPLK